MSKKRRKVLRENGKAEKQERQDDALVRTFATLLCRPGELWQPITPRDEDDRDGTD